MSEQDRHLALNEAKILSKLKHKNIVRYKEAFVAQGKLCIAMEFAEKGKKKTWWIGSIDAYVCRASWIYFHIRYTLICEFGRSTLS